MPLRDPLLKDYKNVTEFSTYHSYKCENVNLMGENKRTEKLHFSASSVKKIARVCVNAVSSLKRDGKSSNMKKTGVEMQCTTQRKRSNFRGHIF